MTETDTRDRVIRLEEQVRHLAQALIDMKESQDDTNNKVTELRDLFLQGKGAAWAGRLLWAVLLSLIGGLAMKIAGVAHWIFGR